MQKKILLLIKILLIGLLLQFLLHTFVTFKLGVTAPRMDSVRMRKELLIVLLGGILCRYMIRHRQRKMLREDKTILILQGIFVFTLAITALGSLLINNQPLSQFILACKYDFIGFFLFFLFYHLGSFFSTPQKNKLIAWYVQIGQRLLILGICWWLVILIKPGALEILFGYNRNLFEGVIGMAPPATYKTQLGLGIVRNQFLFERPIMRGFWLTAFWPLFYVFFLKRKSLTKTRGWRGLYILNVGLTFSRAAWISWILLTIVLLALTYKKQFLRIIRKALIPGIICGAGILYIAPHYRQRQYSNTGHIEMIRKGRNIFVENPIWGQGAGTAGPGSHHLGDDARKFNPENQFIQILDEFGITGSIGWFILFGRMVGGILPSIRLLWKQSKHHALSKEEQQILWVHIAFGVGMFGLGISGMVLHSFVDRMIVYPFMLLYGLAYQQTKKQTTSRE